MVVEQPSESTVLRVFMEHVCAREVDATREVRQVARGHLWGTGVSSWPPSSYSSPCSTPGSPMLRIVFVGDVHDLQLSVMVKMSSIFGLRLISWCTVSWKTHFELGSWFGSSIGDSLSVRILLRHGASGSGFDGWIFHKFNIKKSKDGAISKY
jgi:hypothetical protein